MSDHSLPAARPSASPGVLLAAFAASLCVSAFLLFAAQPMFAKMVLPKLGGSPAVWSFALVFFQAVLLLGYGYAHVIARALSQRAGMAVHALVLAAAFASLPIAFPEGWERMPDGFLLAWLGALFALGTGLPFFAISATAPLLQSWFSRSGHPQAVDPYFLYAASNLGSFAALMLYPLALEPLFSLGDQAYLWSAGFVLLTALIAACGLLVPADGRIARASAASRVTAAQRWTWAGTAAVPSGLLVAVTAFITTDIVAVPFFWVAPLGLFLITFVIVFAKSPAISHGRALWLHSLVAVPFALTLFSSFDALLLVPLHLTVFFISVLVCHGELARARPAAEHLTEFYFFMSLGGVAGGVFASLAAPFVFSQVLEYPILLVLVFLCRADARAALLACKQIDRWPFALAVLLAVAIGSGLMPALPADSIVLRLARAGIVLALFAARDRLALQAGLMALGLTITLGMGTGQHTIERARSLFGVNAVILSEDGRFHVLAHGTTLHGAQAWANGRGVAEPLSYYYKAGPFGAALGAIRQKRGPLADVAVIGLGAGALACQRQPGEAWRFYEIDAEVIRIARDAKLFGYLDQCTPDAQVVTGDGRITLGAAPDRAFDVIVLDAFSSDTVPAHLLTREALRLYSAKLKTGGVIVLHISNRYMELAGVVASTAAAEGLSMRFNRMDPAIWKPDAAMHMVMPRLAVLARAPEDMGPLAADPAWVGPGPAAEAPWTDSYSNILPALWRKFRE